MSTYRIGSSVITEHGNIIFTAKQYSDTMHLHATLQEHMSEDYQVINHPQ